jgi:hypothetical protein
LPVDPAADVGGLARRAKLSPEGIANIIAYLETVRRVVQRLLDDGYRIVDGEIVPPEEDERQLRH